jgi:hypothetical protein
MINTQKTLSFQSLLYQIYKEKFTHEKYINNAYVHIQKNQNNQILITNLL